MKLLPTIALSAGIASKRRFRPGAGDHRPRYRGHEAGCGESWSKADERGKGRDFQGLL